MLNVIPIPAFNDNYIWCLTDADSGRAAVVDPGEGEVHSWKWKRGEWKRR